MLAVVAPADLEPSVEAEEILDALLVRMQPGAFRGHSAMVMASPGTPFSGAMALRPGIALRHHHRIDAPRRHRVEGGVGNAGLLVLLLIGFEGLEADRALLHRLGADADGLLAGLRSHPLQREAGRLPARRPTLPRRPARNAKPGGSPIGLPRFRRRGGRVLWRDWRGARGAP